MSRGVLVAACLVAVACGQEPAGTAVPPGPGPPERLELGTPATPGDIAAWDIDVNARGDGLPAGSGTAADGWRVYAARCAACHGPSGQGGSGSQLVAPAHPAGPARRNVATHWPWAPPLFDYIRRTMPPDAPGSLPDTEVYAVVAFLLSENRITGPGFVADAASLPRVTMPSRGRFVPDDRRGGRAVK